MMTLLLLLLRLLLLLLLLDLLLRLLLLLLLLPQSPCARARGGAVGVGGDVCARRSGARRRDHAGRGGAEGGNRDVVRAGGGADAGSGVALALGTMVNGGG